MYIRMRHIWKSCLSFQGSGVIETGLFDLHKMIVTLMETTFQKPDPKIIHYRDYEQYCNDSYRQDLFSAFGNGKS